MMAFFSDRIVQRAERRALRLARRFQKDDDGATAVEFAFVSLPFFALLFGIMELAVVFFVNSALVHATSEAGRLIRVGNFQACGGADEFKAIVCDEMKGMANCSKNLRVDVVEGDSFKTITLPDIPPVEERDDTQTGQDAIPQTPNGVFDTNSAGDTMVVRSTFYYRLVLPPLLTRLDSPAGSGARTMVATTAFRNEPFPDSGTCDANTQSRITDGTPS
jgi:Flp pilus assembly protein TadG